MGRNDNVMLARVMYGRGLAGQFHQLVGLPRHGRDDDRALVACIHLALHMVRGYANPVKIRDGRSAHTLIGLCAHMPQRHP
jgi:hypothetical protein